MATHELRPSTPSVDPAVLMGVPVTPPTSETPAAEPGGWTGFSYWRLHGSPQMYWSAYGPDRVDDLAGRLASAPQQPAWVFFDNTTSGAAAADALLLQARLAC